MFQSRVGRLGLVISSLSFIRMSMWKIVGVVRIRVQVTGKKRWEGIHWKAMAMKIVILALAILIARRTIANLWKA